MQNATTVLANGPEYIQFCERRSEPFSICCMPNHRVSKCCSCSTHLSRGKKIRRADDGLSHLSFSPLSPECSFISNVRARNMPKQFRSFSVWLNEWQRCQSTEHVCVRATSITIPCEVTKQYYFFSVNLQLFDMTRERRAKDRIKMNTILSERKSLARCVNNTQRCHWQE